MHIIFNDLINQVIKLREDRTVVGYHYIGQGQGYNCTVVASDSGTARQAGLNMMWSWLGGGMANYDRYGLGTLDLLVMVK